MADVYPNDVPPYVPPRSGCLTAWLVMVGLHNVAAIALLVAVEYFLVTHQLPPVWGLLGLGVLSMVNILATVAVWMRQKLGWYVYLLSAIASAIICVADGHSSGLPNCLVPPLILWALVSKEWYTYE